ncbi:MAG: DUF1566 domain-containing protein [Syntrophales bacterium]
MYAGFVFAGEKARDGRFIAYDDGTVLDTSTNLMWAAKDNGRNINWAKAKSYCENYRGGGHTDWWLPTQYELAGIYDADKISKNLPTGDCRGGYHITELIHLTCCCPMASKKRGSSATRFNFIDGRLYWAHQSHTSGTRALPVRSAK